MRIVFADAFYWIALINPGDDWHLARLQPHRLHLNANHAAIGHQ